MACVASPKETVAVAVYAAVAMAVADNKVFRLVRGLREQRFRVYVRIGAHPQYVFLP